MSAPAFAGVEPPTPPPPHPTHGAAAAVYWYDRADGSQAFCVCRYDLNGGGKTFAQGRPTAQGWAWNLRGIELVLYRLPELHEHLASGDRGPIYLCEGEKDAEALRAFLAEHGLPGFATCNPMGAGKWKSWYTDALTGARHVVIVADNDEPGIAHARTIAAALGPHVGRVDVVRSALDEAKADLSDHLAAGLGLEELAPLEAEEERAERVWLRSAADLLRQPDPGPTPYAVEHLIVEGALAVVQGDSKVGKTWTLLELARAIVTGEPAFGRFDVQQGPVILVLEESGERALHRRLDALMRGNAQRPEDYEDLHYAANLRVKLDDPEWQKRLLEAAVELRPRLIALDPLVRMKGAGRDENSQLEMGVVIDYLIALRAEAEAAVGFAHHTGHEGARLRGSSDLEAVWESKIVVSKDDGLRHVSSEHREAEAGPSWHYRLGWDAETRTVRLRAEEDAKRQEVRDHLREHPDAPATEVWKAVGGRKQTVLELVKEEREQLSFERPEGGGSAPREPAGTAEPGPLSGSGSPEGPPLRSRGPSGTAPQGRAAGAVPGSSEEGPDADGTRPTWGTPLSEEEIERLRERHADIAEGKAEHGSP